MSFLDKLKESGESIIRGTKDAGNTAVLTAKIVQEKQTIANIEKEIGHLYAEKYMDDPDADFLIQLAQLRESQARLKEMEEQKNSATASAKESFAEAGSTIKAAAAAKKEEMEAGAAPTAETAASTAAGEASAADAPAAEAGNFCPNCGKPAAADDAFCQYCGTPLIVGKPEEEALEEEAPAEATPVEEAPTDETPTEEAPTDETPAEEAPTEE